MSDEVTYAQLLQAQIASAEAAKHLMQQETFGFRTHAGPALRISFGLPKNLPPEDVMEVLDEYIAGLQEEYQAACKEV